jgi:hypothetical protein
MPKLALPLTQRTFDAKIAAARRANAKVIEIADGSKPGGLRARIRPSGVLWSLSIQNVHGVRKRFKVDYAGSNLAEARKAADEVRSSVRSGADPSGEAREKRRREREGKRGVGMLGEAIRAYFETGKGASQRQAVKSEQRIRLVFGKLLDKPSLHVTRIELQLQADSWPSKHNADLAVRVLRPLLRWRVKRGYVHREVQQLDQSGFHVAKRDRVLSAGELKAVWPHLTNGHGKVFRWLLWTGCRLREATEATWVEISSDFTTWTIQLSPMGYRFLGLAVCWRGRIIWLFARYVGCSTLALRKMLHRTRLARRQND